MKHPDCPECGRKMYRSYIRNGGWNPFGWRCLHCKNEKDGLHMKKIEELTAEVEELRSDNIKLSKGLRNLLVKK